jgi:hypothetical protein
LRRDVGGLFGSNELVVEHAVGLECKDEFAIQGLTDRLVAQFYELYSPAVGNSADLFSFLEKNLQN